MVSSGEGESGVWVSIDLDTRSPVKVTYSDSVPPVQYCIMQLVVWFQETTLLWPCISLHHQFGTCFYWTGAKTLHCSDSNFETNHKLITNKRFLLLGVKTNLRGHKPALDFHVTCVCCDMCCASYVSLWWVWKLVKGKVCNFYTTSGTE